ncbi:ATP-binding protein [Natrinema longum]|uniref:ATP-binding protein n=1 Tax=Natrinema longum TaxID=370324 RepID=A0A8A2U551_9EURY|nr:AAA family ATPase [Natrinema longum]MBZ6494858.1 AAA family ATPase [Natrinema longum]QSW83843.1 ATP-binding protein [Natrinema longum]
MGYATTQEHLLAELERIDMILDRYERTMESGDPRKSAPDDEEPNAATMATEPKSLQLALPEGDRREIDELTQTIEQNCEDTGADITLRLRVLEERFDLSRRHLDVLLLALAPRLDDTVAAQYQHIQEHSALPSLTVILLEKLFGRTPEERLAAGALVASNSPLQEHGLLTVNSPPEGFPSERGRQYTVDDRILEYLKGYDGIDPTLEAAIDAHSPADLDEHLTETAAEATLEDLLIDDDGRAALASLPDGEDGTGRRFYFCGPPGSGVDRAVEACCRAERYLQADLRAVLAADALEALVREATIQDVPVQLVNADEATVADRQSDHSLEGVLARFRAFDNDLFVTGEQSWTPAESRRASVDAIHEFDRPSIALRRQFWAARADDLPADLEPETMASTFDLTQGQLEAALATADSLAGGDDPTLEDVRAGCRAQSSSELAELAQHVDPSKTWADIEVDERTERQLGKLETHVTNRGLIYDDWGFREADGNAGIVSLFKGHPGTGKTLAAEVLANAVGMALYKIDLSTVVSKYIGETEENLERIFRAAEQSNAILLFDEADSIFGDRAEVSDATDRYANVEVNYLLQRVETYDGVIFLTTNYAQNIDTAFTRRITHSIRFDEPDDDTREEIWKGIFPDDCPLEGIDWEWLAAFDYSGGTIEKLAKHVAIYVADRGEDTITMRHVVEALEEYKRDRNSRIREQDFEPYLEYLQGPTEREAKERLHRERHGN